MNRIFTLIAMCVFAIGVAFAEETTIDFASLYGDAKVQPATPVTSGLSRSRLKKAIQPQNLPISLTRVLRKCACTAV